MTTPKRRPRYTAYALGLGLAWTLFLVGAGTWSVWRERAASHEIALAEARAHFNKDQAFRFWASSHGGAYVPVDKATPPNPYLAHVKDRDITTPSGVRLTLMNPAYMVRQMHERYRDLYGVYGHITSLKPLRPANGPDAWERAALEALERGEAEVSGPTEIDGKPYLRLMQPMVAKETCLKCHGHQGYKVGDVRGGVSVALPLEGLLANQRDAILRQIAILAAIWLAGLAGTAWARHLLARRARQVEHAEAVMRAQRDMAMELARCSEDQKTLLDTVFQATPDLLALKDRGLVYRAVNPAFCEFVGRPAEEILGRTDGELFPPDEAEERRRADTAVMESGCPRSEDELAFGAAGPQWLSVSTTPVLDRDGKPAGVLCAARIVSDRKRAEVLLAAERDLALRLAHAKDLGEALNHCLGVALQVSGRSTGGIWLIGPSGAAELACHRGASADLVCLLARFDAGTPLMELLRPGRAIVGSVDSLPGPLAQVCRDHGLRSVAMLPVLHEGQWIATLSVGSHTLEAMPAWVSRALEAVTVHLREAIVRLRGQQRLFTLERAIEQSSSTVVITDREGAIEYVNPRFVQTTGYTREEALGQNPRILKSGQQPDELYAALWRTISSGQDWRGEFRNRRKDGTLYWEAASISPITDVQGRITHFVAVKDDITDRKRAEDDLRRQIAVTAAINRVIQGSFQAETDVEVARLCLAEAENLTGSKFGWIGEVDPSGRLDTIALSDPGWACCRMPGVSEASLRGMEIRGIFGRAIKDGRPLIANDPATHPVRVGLPSGHPELTSFLGVPLKRDGRTIGLVALGNKPSGYGPEDQEAVEAMSVAFVAALQRKRAEHRYRVLFESSQDAIMTLAPPSWEFTSGNPAAVALFGARNEAEFTSLGPWQVSPETQPDGHPSTEKAKEMIATAMREGSHCFRWTHRRLSGEDFPAIVQLTRVELANRTFLQATVRDVTAQGQAEEALRLSEEQYRQLFAAASDALIVFDLEGTVVEVNPAACQMYRYARDEFIGLTGRDFIHPGSVHLFQAFKDQVGTGNCFATESVDLHKDRSPFHVEVHGSQVSFRGEPHLLAAVRDITERRKAEEELRRTVTALETANAALEHFNEIAESASRAKSEFLANMSHEIRTPMTAILGFTDVLLGEPGIDGAPSDRVDALRTIQRNGQYLLGLINDILDLSRIEAGKLGIQPTACSPAQLLAEVIGLMQVRADAKNLPLHIEYGGGMPEWIHSDPLRLRQILINLVGNAIKFTETGSVRVAARLVGTPGQPALLQIDVIDTGIGLTQAQIARLFKPFHQADSSTTRRFGGTGLGLMISKRLAQMLGGDITVTSSPGRGSTFRLTVEAGDLRAIGRLKTPEEAALPAAPACPKSPAEAVRLERRILFAEDGPDNQRLIAFLLRKAGAEVTVAENGQIAYGEALAARDRGEPFDAILMDMQMPVMDGYEATRRLRAAGYTAPIVALTAHAMEGDEEECRAAGCSAYVSKPIDVNRFARTLAEMLGENRQPASLPERS